MLTTAAWPEASRKRRPSEVMIPQPSPRTAMGKVFLKLREKSPLFVAMRCPGKDCSRVASARSNARGRLRTQVCASTQNGAYVPPGGSGGPEVDNAARAAGNLGDRPVIVLTAGKYFISGDPDEDRKAAAFHEVWVHQLQQSLARLSTRGKQVIVENSDHGIQYEAPDAVVDAVREVVTQIRTGQH